MRFPTVATLTLPFLVAHAGAGPAAAADCAAQGACAVFGKALPAAAADERADARLNGRPWIGAPWQATPFMLQESAPSYSVRTSLAHYFSYREQRKLAGEGLAAAYKRPGTPPPVDVWTTFDVARDDDQGLLRGTLGADLRLGRQTVVGVAVERGELVNGDDERVVTYFKQRVATGFTWRLKGGFGRGIVAQDNTALAVENTYLSAQVSRQWTIAGLTLSPQLELQSQRGSLEARTGAAAWSNDALIVASRVSRPFDLGASQRLEPFVAITQSLDAASGADTGHSLEGGLKLEVPSDYTLSATTSLKRSESEDAPALSGRVELKVPLR